MEARAREEHDRELQEEVKRLVNEKLARAAQRDKRLEEKLTEVLEDRLSQEVLEIDLEAEEVGTTGGTQSLAMEVNEEGEDEVIVVEEVKQGETRKRVLSLPPKALRKRVRVGTVTQMPVGSQVMGSSVQGSQAGSGNVGSTGKPCWRGIKHRVECIVLSSGA